MEVVFLVLTLLPGLTVLAFFVNLLPFFLGTWPVGSEDLGHFGVSFLELLILFEQWAGHRLLSEKVTRTHVRANRPILIPSVLVFEEIEIRHVCQILSSLFVHLTSCLVVLVGSCLVGLVLTCPGKGILDGISVLMGPRLDPWNPVIIDALRLYVGFRGIPKDLLRSFWMAL